MGSSPERKWSALVAIYLTIVLLVANHCWGQNDTSAYNSVLLSSVSYPDRWLSPHDWTYVRIELPTGFSSLAVTVKSDVDVPSEVMKKSPKTVLPIMCFKHGGLPVPDISENSLNEMASNFVSNGTIGDFSNLLSEVQCFPFKKSMRMKLTNEQIPSGVWYAGYFNGLGPARTQSDMIDRGRSHRFSITVNIEGCISSSIWGPYCNQTINLPSCSLSIAGVHSRSVLDTTMHTDSKSVHSRSALDTTMHTDSKSLRSLTDNWNSLLTNHQVQSQPNTHFSVQTSLFNKQRESMRSRMLAASESIITCNSSSETSCIGSREQKLYSLDVTGPTYFFEVMVDRVKFKKASSENNTINFDGILLMCYVRYNAFPSREIHDYSADIIHSRLVIHTPKAGNWYISVEAVNQTKANGVLEVSDLSSNLCFSMTSRVKECPGGKAGFNCSWEKHILQKVSTRSSELPFESYYLPDGEVPSESVVFPLEPLLSNFSFGNSTVAWTYFLLDVPTGASGSNLHLQLTSERKLDYEIYLKFGGLPSLDDWDYYVNSTARNISSMLLISDDSNEEIIDFYIVYPKEGTWTFGITHPAKSQLGMQSLMSISTERCPRHCSFHGQCLTDVDESGLTTYGFCSCGRNHGGFDCSIELVSHQERVWRSVALIASNGASILPALFALRHKAFAEWIIYTFSGISSGIYHACDVGIWCPLSFRVLQFLDFWLSFMAVVSTFIYLTTMSESSKRAILAGFSILTAILAVNGATKSENIIIVVAIGTTCLLIGWSLEYLRRCGIRHFSCGCNIGLSDIWKTIRTWPMDILLFLHQRFRWYFLLLGFVALSAAAVCWKLENSENYWIWHSLWHITIYSSSFFFLCSKLPKSRNEEARQPVSELTQQNSISRIGSTEEHC